MKIGIVVYEQCTASMVMGMLDILAFSNLQARASGGEDLFTIELLSGSGEPVNTFSRFPIRAHRSIPGRKRYDLVYVPGFVGEVEPVLKREGSVVKWLGRQQARGTVLTAACNGNFLLAESGALDGKKATTHWNLAGKFRARYRDVTLEPEKIIVDGGDTISAAGVTAYFNLALFIIERYGSKELSLLCAKVFLVDSGRKIQTPYQMYQLPKSHGDEEIVRVQEWMEANYREPMTLAKLADIAHLSKKTLMRRFRKATGETPLAYLQKLRVENAKRLLESGNASFHEITWEVGYSDVSSFHRTFKSETGLTPIAYRSKFSML